MTESVGEPQTEAVAQWLLDHGSITPRDAMTKLNCWRLGARIYELRELLGAEVISTTNESHGSGTHARYVLNRPLELSIWLTDRRHSHGKKGN